MNRRVLIVTVSASMLLAATPQWAVASPPPLATTAPPASTGDVDPTLGNGLGRLLAEADPSGQRRAGSGLRIDQDALAIRDGQDRVLVDLTPRAGADRAAFRTTVEGLGLQVTAVDDERGTLEGFADLSAIRRLADLPDTGTIAQALKPQSSTGSVTSQGVPFQRIDKVQAAGISGAGITIGALSDSYDTATTDVFGEPLAIHAADDVASGDLPGPGNPVNATPVAVLEDEPSGSSFDEGRAMLQIAHDVAPQSKLCFATAFTGEIGFADNIRRLADPAGPCGADVIVDDVSYFSEPFFSDGPIARAVDDVAAAGVSYLSSAGNNGDSQAWEAPVELTPATDGAVGANLDLSQVPADLYDGGLQDMNPGAGVDVAQTLRLGEAGGLFDLQWDDPVDVDGAELGDALFSAAGELTTAVPSQEYAFTPTADQVGQQVEIVADGVPAGTTDLVLTVVAPDGTPVGPIDTGTSPESIALTLSAGTYRIIVDGFEGATGGFTLDVRPVLSLSATTTDFNVLIFDPAGNYLGALADDNPITGRPSEIASLAGLPELQIAIGRAGTGPGALATTLRYINNGDINTAEYADPLSPAIFGHPAAAGAIAVAAYDPFRPYLPEFFTSPGGDLPFYFDADGNRLDTPQIRRKPEIASTDGGNTTFFVSDSDLDDDAFPNFFGTSAAAPHAAAIVALLLEKRGGPGSLTPDEVRTRLQKSTFAHDLDPNSAFGRAAGLTISATGAQGSEASSQIPGAMADSSFFEVRYRGRVPLASITFYGETADPTALGNPQARKSGGLVFDPRPFTGEAPFTDQGFPFTVGRTTVGLADSRITASFSAPAPAPSVAGQYRHMTVTIANGLPGGAGFSFGVDRDTAVLPGGSSRAGNSADELGGATVIPQGRACRAGMVFVATRTDGRRLVGVMTNRIGAGWSPLDGYGLVNAERAVLGTGR